MVSKQEEIGEACTLQNTSCQGFFKERKGERRTKILTKTTQNSKRKSKTKEKED